MFLGVSIFLLSLVSPVSAVGVFRQSNGNWYLDYNKTGVVDKTFHFGTTGDIPVTGDWNGDGSTEAGVFRPSNGNWYLDYNKTGVVDKTFHFGTTGDIPVTGDWNGDGTTGAGVFRPSNGNWYLDYNKTGVVDKTFHFGTTGDIPVTGDWNGDGSTEVGVFRTSNGNWYLDTTKTGVVNKTFHFGTTGDIPVTGDWNGNGSTKTGVFRPSNGNWYLDYNKTGVVDKTFHFGTTGDTPVVGDWNSDGTTEVGVFRTSNGNWYLDTTKTGVVNKTFHFGTTGDSPKIIQLPKIVTIAPTAAFTSDKQTGTAPLTVTFTDQSTGTSPLTWAWDFNNDGANDSTLQNPSFTYTSAGTYTVNLTVTNAVGNNTVIKTGYITVNTAPVAPTAAFTSDKRTGITPLTVTFTDQSSGTSPLTWAWDFNNDGTTDSTLQNPSFTYASAGTYTVNLTVTNAVGNNTVIKTGYITVTGSSSGSHPGIALTFDDNSIGQWYAIRDLLKQYNAHATFFVTQYANLDESQINELRALQADGNEIGYHGYAHLDATEYLTNHTIAEYMNNEIINGVTLMRADGFDTVDFALPDGAGDENASLMTALQQYFTHIRGIDRAPPYYQYGSGIPLIHAQGIDDLSYGQSINDLYRYINTAKANDEIVIFYAHIPVQNVTGDYQVSYDRLDKMLKNGTDNNMKFYTVSEIN